MERRSITTNHTEDIAIPLKHTEENATIEGECISARKSGVSIGWSTTVTQEAKTKPRKNCAGIS